MPRPRCHGRPLRRRPSFEQLETRTLLSGTPGFGIVGDPGSAPGPVWTVVGDQDPAQLDDTIVIRHSPQDAKLVEAVVNGTVVSSRRVAGLTLLRIRAGAGDDAVTINVADPTFAIRVWGGAGNDHLTGHNGSEHLFGGPGDDVLDGGGGRDVLRGGAGDDMIHGGLGADRLDGGAGVNTFFGRQQQDRVIRAAGQNTFRHASANPLHRAASIEQLRDWVVKAALDSWTSMFGQKAGPIWVGGPWRGEGLPVFAPDRVATAAETSGTGTNTQEAGVDEADILKTDGHYLYTIVGGKLLVIDASNPEELAIVGEAAIDAGVEAFYLLGDHAVLLSRTYEYDAIGWPEPLPGDTGDGVARISAPLWWRPFRVRTTITTIDLSDRTAPTVEHKTTLDGSLVDSRAVNGRVYVVVENNLSIPQPRLIETDDGYVYESEEEYRARLDVLDLLPGYDTTDYTGEEDVYDGGSLVEGADLYLPEVITGRQLLSVAVFDPAADTCDPVAITTIAGTSGNVYASAESLYVAATDYISPWRGGGASTQIYKFALQGDAVPLDAVGVVGGTILNQFSMDDEAGFFRIATTSGWGDRATNSVYVMADTGDNLEVIGAVKGLAKGERIFSVRFEGDVGFVVTFRQVDPLFALDLSNPFKPQVAGELKIPGYSSYLQSIGDGRLIGLGRDVDEDTGRVLGLQVSLFDVSNLSQPKQSGVFSFSADDWGGWSEAEWDHHAISYFADAGVLALPVSTGWDDPAALEVLHVGPSGFELLGEIAHDSPVLRSLHIGDWLFSMSYGEIQVHLLSDPTHQVGAIDLPAPPPTPPGDGPIFIGRPVIAIGFAE
jgi:uncharacterized secreted protein with C-terminal beta-propeller domain